MIKAVFFDIGGTVHTQDATPESDRDYIRRLWCFLHMNHIYTAETPEQLLEQAPGFDFATLCDFERPAAVP